MGSTICVVKSKGKRKTEYFDRDKLHASITAACLSVYAPEGQADSIANTVCDSVVAYLQQLPEVTSLDIRTIVAKKLKNHHPEAAYLYEQHHITI
jgi:transcriptional regulator NrdR family protein